MTYMLDTDMCIYIINTEKDNLKDKLNQHSDKLVISTITLAELIFGVENSERRDANFSEVLDFIGNLSVISFDDKAALEYGKVRALLQKAGTPIGPNDSLIAAHALSTEATLVTNNVKEFSRVESLSVENWL